ncbi:MAG: aminoglycoside phosphotransferase family protein [Alphaproteobacteria bacterium]
MISSDKIDISTLKSQIGVENITPLPRDASPREYFRGIKSDQKFVLMLYPEVNSESRAELLDFIRIGKWINDNGIKSPQCIELYEKNGFALFEDLGETSFGEALRKNIETPQNLYQSATDVLCVLRDAQPPNLPQYNQSRIHKNRRQLIDYYVTFIRGAQPSEETTQGFLSVWDTIESSLPPCPQGFVHGDYHLENLIYQPTEQGIKKCALIDFQDALNGPLPYDLMNLLEDARVDVPADIKANMIERYCAQMSETERKNFKLWYRVLAAQFHGRVLGLFIKLAAEQERDKYLIHIPRLQSYMIESLKSPILAPLKSWFEKEGVDFTLINDLDGNDIRRAFQNIAF